MNCVDCDTDISGRHHNAYLCPPCQKSREVLRHAEWNRAHPPRSTAHRLAYRAAWRRAWRARTKPPMKCQTEGCLTPVAFGAKKFCADCGIFFRTSAAARGRALVQAA